MLRKKLGIECIEMNWEGKYISSYFKVPTSLIIPDGCNWIGIETFWGCKRLEKVVIPESVNVIGRAAFWCCKSLKEVVIPKSVEYIGQRAFDGCPRAIIILKKPMSEFKSIGCNAFWNLLYVKEETRN